MVVRFLGVVVPARDEEDAIGPCLRSIEAAAAHPLMAGVEVRAITVLDRCGDRAAAAGASRLLEVRHGNVGAARAEGFEALLAEADGLDPAEVWLATTDADSLVPRHWLACQLAYADGGVDAVAGTIRVDDWSEQPVATRERFLRYQGRVGLRRGHGHIHGANLGLSAATYLAAGGMPRLALAEDHALWEGLRATGGRLVSAADLPVVTSARRESRAPGGFSAFLRSL